MTNQDSSGRRKPEQIEQMLLELEAQQKMLDDQLKEMGIPDLDDLDDFDPYQGYSPLLKTLSTATDDALLTEIEAQMRAGANPNQASPFSETPVAIAFGRGRMDAIALLASHGADLSEFLWNDLHRAIALGTFDEVVKATSGDVLAEFDSAGRSPFLLACRLGDLEKAEFLQPLTPPHALVCSDEGEGALHVAVRGEHENVVDWLMAAGADVNAADAYGGTPLLLASEHGNHTLIRKLLDAGADPLAKKNLSQSLDNRRSTATTVWAKAASLIGKSTMGFTDDAPDTIITPASAAHDVDSARMFLLAGVPPEEFEQELLPELTGASQIPKQQITPEIFKETRTRQYGSANPEICRHPFWIQQIRTGNSGYTAETEILGTRDYVADSTPVWSFDRFGRTSTRLPDGRWVLIAGEHEDSYDADFCIYNDVTVLDGQGGVVHYTYPKNVFPPTDFHTATLLDDRILLIGSLSYQGMRREQQTQVLSLSLTDFSITSVETTGSNPGWINRHSATLDGRTILVSGGKVEPGFQDLKGTFTLDMESLIWRRVS